MKPWYKSTTLWLNVAGILAISLQLIAKSNAVVDPDVLAIILAVANILNRFRTNTKLTK